MSVRELNAYMAMNYIILFPPETEYRNECVELGISKTIDVLLLEYYGFCLLGFAFTMWDLILEKTTTANTF